MTQKPTWGELYAELGDFGVELQQTPQLGPGYIREKLFECQRKRDRVCDFVVRALEMRTAIANALDAVEHEIQCGMATEANKKKRRELKEELTNVKYYAEAVKAKEANLKRTAAAITVLHRVIAQEVALGQIQPPRD